jgi:acyl-CoA reductase-like NAD-dependent aldehyde dehydrogenase
MKIINPATGELIREMQEDDLPALEKKLSLLRAAQLAWQETNIENRIEIIRKFSDLLTSNIESLAATLTSEMGKPLQQARNEINGAKARIRWLTEHAARVLSDEVMTIEPGLEEKIVYEPLGVIGNISAWNYPWLVGVNVFVPALLAGNAVLYKPSEYATLTGMSIEKLLHESGVPKDVFILAAGGGKTGALMLDLPLDGYFFTGSYATGQKIYEKISHKMVPCQCELGGKDPLYVADDVEDIPSVAAATADGAFYNNGQSCCAVERIYVHEKVYDAYLDAFVKEVKSYKLGQPTENGVYIGPLSRPQQAEFLESQVSDAVSKGGRLVAGGHRINGPGYFFEPTVLADATHNMKLMREESFGPIIGIMKVKDDPEAIELMKDTEYGLTAAVYSKSKERAEKILRRIDAGTGYWNCCDRVSAALPWSGRKHSGFGVTLSNAGIRAFTRPKAYHLKG